MFSLALGVDFGHDYGDDGIFFLLAGRSLPESTFPQPPPRHCPLRRELCISSPAPVCLTR